MPTNWMIIEVSPFLFTFEQVFYEWAIYCTRTLISLCITNATTSISRRNSTKEKNVNKLCVCGEEIAWQRLHAGYYIFTESVRDWKPTVRIPPFFFKPDFFFLFPSRVLERCADVAQRVGREGGNQVPRLSAVNVEPRVLGCSYIIRLFFSFLSLRDMSERIPKRRRKQLLVVVMVTVVAVCMD